MMLLSDELRATLLAEAREQYKAEHDRSPQAFSRVGIYFTAVGVILTALYRFGDVAFHPAWSALYVAISLTIMATAAAIVLSVLAMIGRSKTFGALSGVWLEHARTRTSAIRKAAPQITPDLLPGDVERYIRATCEEELIEGLSEAVKKTQIQNQRRFAFLYWVSFALAFALVGLIATGAIYGYSLVITGAEVIPSSAGSSDCAMLQCRTEVRSP